MTGITEKIYKVNGMHCTSCGVLIDEEVEELAIVKSSTTDYKSGTTTVVLSAPEDEAVLDAAVGQAVQTAGYSIERNE